MGKSAKLDMSVCSSKTRIILIGIRRRHKNSWKDEEYASHVEDIMKNADLDEPHSFLAYVYLECTQRESKPNEIFVEEKTNIFESRISAGATEKLRG